MSFNVICFGALNVDKLFKVDAIARESEERSILSFTESPGGSAANTAAGLARLGLNVGYIGMVSNDREGQLILNDFNQEGVNVEGIALSTKGRSGIVIGFIDGKGERALYVDPGVNDSLTFKDINLEYARSANLLHLTSFVGKKPFEAQKRLVTALEDDVLISFDPGDLYSRRGLTPLTSIIKKSLVLFPTEKEVHLLTGKNYEEGSKTLIDLGTTIVAVKLGRRGCYITDGKESHLIESYDVKVVDTTGAGDAFSAGFLYGLLNKKDLYTSGKLGNFVASRCIRKVGAREGLPRLYELPHI